METKIHIGSLIEEKLQEKRLTKQELSELTGIKAVTIRYLTRRDSLDVVTLQRIGNGLKYNFFKHYPIEEVVEGNGEAEKRGSGEKDPSATLRMTTLEEEKKKLQEKITELEKQLEGCKRDLLFQKQENGYLKEINELLKNRK